MTRMTYIRYLILFLFLLPRIVHASFIDLTRYSNDFVLRTKQIHIPGFPGAFNASVVRWKGSLLMCFRVRDEHMLSTFQIGCIWLDEEFNPVGQAHILRIQNSQTPFTQNQDPRLIIIKGKLYILYSNFVKIDDFVTRRMFIAPMQHDGQVFFIEKPVCLDPFPCSSKRWEKNWTPFNYRESLLLAYSQNPHIIFKPSLKTGFCTCVASTGCNVQWSWGELRGGTPAIFDEGKYIAFFHSSLEMKTVHSEGKKIQHYVMGAYRFSSEPPFEITDISPEPIVEKDFYNAPAYPTWKPLRVVFPMGIIIDKRYIWVTYGRQDFEIWVAQLDKKRLYKSLIPCTGTQERPLPQICHKEVEMPFYENMYDIS